MKLLFFTSKPIFPSVDGGCFASEKFLSCLLHANVDVQYATLSTNKHPFEITKFPEVLTEKIQPINYYVDTDLHAIEAFKSLFKSTSYNIQRFYSNEVEVALIELVKTSSFDGIIFDSLYTLSYLDGIRTVFKGKIAVRTHNVEHHLWQYYASEAVGLKKWYLNRLARDLQKFELKKLNEVDAILSISADDSDEFKKMGILSEILNAPVNIKTDKKDLETVSYRIYHIGMMDWEPNRQAVHQLVQWMPELRGRIPNLELHIAGSKSETFIQTDEERGIFVHGFVENVSQFAQNHGVLVSPIRAASGVRIKFLEAMALGIPIVTTTLGALGIDHKSCNCLCIANTKEAFFKHIEELTTNASKREEIGRNALNYIDKNHNIDAISQTIVEVFEANT